MLVLLKFTESWCKRDLLVDLPLKADEVEGLKKLFEHRCGGFTWPAVKLSIPDPPEGRWEAEK